MPVGPPPMWAPPRPRPPAALFAIVFMVIIVFVFAIGAFVMLSGFGAPAEFLFAPLCGIVLFMVVIAIVFVAMGAAGFQRRSLPPPPPIQQPMVPAGMQGPVDLACPNCGAPPQNVDRFGVATCTYCSTRFIVR